MTLDAIARTVRGLRDGLDEPIDPTAFTWFRRCFLGKFLLLDLLSLVSAGRPTMAALAQIAVLSASVALAETRRGEPIGAAIILALKLVELVSNFPYTINHAFFDAALLLLLAFRTPEERGGLHPLRVAKAGILAVFFYAGVQKLVHGYYIDGQLLALRALYDDGDMGRRLRWLLSTTGGLLGWSGLPAGALPRPSFVTEAEVTLPGWAWSAVHVLSNGTWIAETGLSVLALHPATRAWAVIGLLGLEGVILIVTGEISFGFTVVACLLSFFPCVARRIYPLGFLALGVVAAVF